MEYRCKEARGAGFSIQCPDGNPWWGSCHTDAWPTCNLSSEARARLPTFKAPLESDYFATSLPASISTQYASVDPALLILSYPDTSGIDPVSLTTPTPDCNPPPPPPLEDGLLNGASITLVDNHLLVACGGSKCYSWDMEQRQQWQFYADTRFIFTYCDISVEFFPRERREGHNAAALKNGGNKVFLFGGNCN